MNQHNSQKGFAPHLLILLAALGIITYLLISSSASFKNNLFSMLYPKPSSHAATLPIIFKSQSGAELQNNPDGIPITTSANIKIELTSTLGPPQLATASAIVTATDSAQATSSSGINSVYTTFYRIAETVADLDNAAYLPYNSAPVIVNYTFKDTKLGSKNIFVDFKDTTNKVERKSARINLISDTKVDTLSFFISKHQDKGLTGLQHPLSQKVVGQLVYYVKWDNKTYEILTWDDAYIYLKEDHSGAPVNYYSFSPGKWMRRQMAIGDTITVSDNKQTEYNPTCVQVNQRPFPIEMTLEAQIPDYDVGGELSKQQVIVLKYDSAVGLTTGVYEKYYYSNEWGWINWEEYSKATNALTNHSTFNKVTSTPIQPDKTVSCTTPPTTPIPTPTASPTPTPTPVASSTPTPRPSATPTPRPSATASPTPSPTPSPKPSSSTTPTPTASSTPIPTTPQSAYSIIHERQITAQTTPSAELPKSENPLPTEKPEGGVLGLFNNLITKLLKFFGLLKG